MAPVKKTSSAHLPAKPKRFVMARLGTFIVSVHREQDIASIKEGLVRALEDDTRVPAVENPTIDPEWSTRVEYWPPRARGDSNALLDGSDVFYGLTLSDPIQFTVKVPAKNQPRLANDDTAPTDTYCVVWDGTVVAVGWEQSNRSVGLTGGQIVEDILRDAAHAAGHHLITQACNPACEFLFIHKTFILNPGTAGAATRSADRAWMELPIPAAATLGEATDEIYWEMRSTLRDFAESKNIARRLLEVESSARRQLTALLRLYRDHAARAAMPLYRSISARWRARGWRKDARGRIAYLWQAIAIMELLRRNFDERRLEFYKNDPVVSLDEFFDRDLDEFPAVASLNLDLMQTATEQAAVRLDSRAVALAPAWGAIAGGVMGALASRLF